MKIISIDVGIKNLAYCLMDYNGETYSILEWDIIDLCNKIYLETNKSFLKELKRNEKSYIQILKRY